MIKWCFMPLSTVLSRIMVTAHIILVTHSHEKPRGVSVAQPRTSGLQFKHFTTEPTRTIVIWYTPTRQNILSSSKLKTFTDNKIYVNQKYETYLSFVRIHGGKTGYQYFFPFLTMFSIAFFSKAVQSCNKGFTTQPIVLTIHLKGY